ncbi:hypothetical protein M9Y10_045060 [Tritrichomonas musculus]|uniref:Myb-like DNA-binding domain containing protein n=1 Tax=Tritrichomonas musculus TaxID=1915356 RepID=A0ABR2JUY1_9EUKA
MVFIQPLIDIAIFYATGRSPQLLEKEKMKRLNAILEDFILNNNVNKIESSMQQIIQEGYDPKCIPKVFKILQIQPYSELKDKTSNNTSSINSKQTNGVLTPDIPFQNQIGDPLDPSNRRRHRSPPWSTEEDERLIAGIFHFGFSDWQKVSTFVGKGRTRTQCGQRWLRCLDPNMNKEKWTPEEDATLKKLVELYGVHSWARIAKELGNRTDVQCRYRYVRCAREPPNFANNQSIPQFPNFSPPTLYANSQQQQQQQSQIQHIQSAEHRIIQPFKQKQSNFVSSSPDTINSTMSAIEPSPLPNSVIDVSTNLNITDSNSEEPKDLPLTPFAYQNVLPLIKPQVVGHNLPETPK